MAKTVVGLVDEHSHAQMLLDDLEKMGFSGKSVHVLAHDTATGQLKSLFKGRSGGGEVDELTALGVPRADAETYAEGVRRGSTCVAVAGIPDEKAQPVADLFYRHGVVDLDHRGDYLKQSGHTAYAPAAASLTADEVTAERARIAEHGRMRGAATGIAASDRTVAAGETVTVPVIEEHLSVGKRQVQGGGARVHTHVIETPVSERVTLREEEVVVDRHAVNRPVSQADLANALQERTISVTETDEVAVVAKEARVVEEVTIGKRATDRVETITDTVRRTDVDVDEIETDLDVRGTTGTTRAR